MNSESSYKEVSRAICDNEVVALPEQIAFYSVDLSEYADAQAAILHIALKGSGAQKSAIAKTFSTRSVFCMPEIHAGDKAASLKIAKYLKNEINELSAEFGVSYSGDAASMAMDILTQFGGMTYLDCIKFFHEAKMGTYKTELQHISVRGITREFLLDWINKYLDQKEECRLAIQEDIKNTIPEPETIEEINKKCNKELMQEINSKAQARKTTIDKVEKLNKELEDDNGIFVFNNIFKIYYNDPEEKIKAWHKLKREEMKTIRKSSQIANNISLKDYFNYEFKKLFLYLKKTYRNNSAQDMCWLIVKRECGDIAKFNEIAGTKIKEGGVYEFHVKKAIGELNKYYLENWNDYAVAKIEEGKTPELKSNWAKNNCRIWCVNKFGKEGDLFYPIVSDGQ